MSKGNVLCYAGTNIPVHYMLPGGAFVNVEDGAKIKVGDVLAKIPQESSKNRDITGGLPRVADLFEARKPKEPAILSEMTGTVSFGKETKGKKRLVITDSEGESIETLIPKFRHINVFEGEHVEKGETLVDGELDSHDIVRIKGIRELTKYMVNEVRTFTACRVLRSTTSTSRSSCARCCARSPSSMAAIRACCAATRSTRLACST